MDFLKHHFLTYVCIGLAAVTAAVLGSQLWLAVPAMTTEQDSSPVIVIDAGHGGEDGGALSASGVRECDLNLQIAGRIHALLTFLGQNSCMLRTEDISLHSEDAHTISEKKVSDLKNRAASVNSHATPVLISIHQNMFTEERYRGSQVFYAPTSGSRELAEVTQTALRESLDPSNTRQIKQADSIYLMNHVNCPAILIECGFLSNRDECRNLCTPEYQKQLSVIISVSSMEYMRKVITNEV